MSRASIVFTGDGEIDVLAPDVAPAEVAQEWLSGNAQVVIDQNAADWIVAIAGAVGLAPH